MRIEGENKRLVHPYVNSHRYDVFIFCIRICFYNGCAPLYSINQVHPRGRDVGDDR